MRIGIAGVGVIGGALQRWFAQNTEHELKLYDPPRGLDDDLSKCDAVFICVPVPTVGRAQDLGIVEEILKSCTHSKQRIFVRSTVLPGTCDRLARKYTRQVYAMPEFLTERIADQDTERQPILSGHVPMASSDQYNFLSEVFEGKKALVLIKNVEAELAKYMHNGNGTVKVAFNNLIYLLAGALGADYERVRAGALLSGYVTATHTQVPGPDGKLGYGGKCFPKDMDALIGLMSQLQLPHEFLAQMQSTNVAIRGVDQRLPEETL